MNKRAPMRGGDLQRVDHGRSADKNGCACCGEETATARVQGRNVSNWAGQGQREPGGIYHGSCKQFFMCYSCSRAMEECNKIPKFVWKDARNSIEPNFLKCVHEYNTQWNRGDFAELPDSVRCPHCSHIMADGDTDNASVSNPSYYIGSFECNDKFELPPEVFDVSDDYKRRQDEDNEVDDWDCPSLGRSAEFDSSDSEDNDYPPAPHRPIARKRDGNGKKPPCPSPGLAADFDSSDSEDDDLPAPCPPIARKRDSNGRKPPFVDNDTKPPFVDNDTKPPFVDNDTKPPFVDNDTKPPFVDNDTKPPFVDNDTKPPFVDNDTKPLSVDSNRKPKNNLSGGRLARKRSAKKNKRQRNQKKKRQQKVRQFQEKRAAKKALVEQACFSKPKWSLAGYLHLREFGILIAPELAKEQCHAMGSQRDSENERIENGAVHGVVSGKLLGCRRRSV